jgi:hypothetical protein
MKIDGRCHCGNISYEAEIDLNNVTICHCTDCQHMSSGPFRSVVFCNEADVNMLGNDPKVYIKTAESGRHREQAFCDQCGTHIYATTTQPPGGRPLGLRAGPIVQRNKLIPKRQLWSRSAQPWIACLNELERVETQ